MLLAEGGGTPPEKKPKAALPTTLTAWTSGEPTASTAAAASGKSPYAPTSGTTRLAPAPRVDIDLELTPKADPLVGLTNSYANPGAGDSRLQAYQAPDQQPGAAAVEDRAALTLQGREEAKETRLENRAQKPKRSYELTQEQYAELSPQQKSAVDFNTELVSAREKDLSADYGDQTKQEAKRYDQSVAQLFGKDEGGSDTFAPETVALLQQIKFKPVADGVGSSLDDFLGLKTAISLKDLEQIDFRETQPLLDQLGAPTPSPAAEQKFGLKMDLADQTDALAKTMAKSHTMLQDFHSTVDAERNPFLKYYGGDTNQVEAGLGFGDDNASVYFRKIFEAFARKDIDTKATWANFDANVPAEDRQKFFDYANTMTQRAEDYRVKLGGVDDVKYRKPEEYRTLLGLDRAEE